MFAAVGDTPYNIILIAHILTAMIAFVPASGLASTTQRMRIYSGSLILSGLLGFGVAGMSDKVFKMSQGWLVAAIIIWIAMNGILHGMLRPAAAAIDSGDGGDEAEKKLHMAGAVFTLLFVVQLYVMVAKPGL